MRRSRDFLRLMREDVLSLKAMGGDPVSEEYLKADLYHRAEAARLLKAIEPGSYTTEELIRRALQGAARE